MGRPKLTPTTNDTLSEQTVNGGGHIVAQHEPLAAPWQIPPEYSQLPASYEPPMPKVTPVVEAKALKVALIGTAPSSRMLAPFNDPSWEIWACSAGNRGALPRVNRWFEIHANMFWPENASWGPEYVNWLRQQPFLIYMQDQSFVPNAISLPKNELVAEFGPYFFTSSFAWMMAMAMKEGAKEIRLFGIDMASREEYIIQRPGAYHFFQEARRRGIKIDAPFESDIMQPPGLYGFSEVTPFGRKMLARKQELTERLNAINNQLNALNQQKVYLDGAMEDIDYINSIWAGAQNNSNGQV